jgi:alkylated DNA repair dioxygenase AlkB
MDSRATNFDLFSDEDRPAFLPPGALLIRCFAATEELSALLRTVDAQPWYTRLSRRVQHYGWRYDYAARRVKAEDALGPLPPWLAPWAERVRAAASAPPFDQVIVAEYLPGQGIAAHTDHQTCFGDTLASLSLGAPTVMVYTHRAKDRRLLPLHHGELLILQGEARHDWRHAIPARRSDVIGNERRLRGRRISLTFRQTRPP